MIGLFCLAVAPDLRRQGLGAALVRGLVADSAADVETVYLQVEEHNVAALAMYERLGFELLYRYRHAVAPAG